MNKGLVFPKDVLFMIFNVMDRRTRIIAGRVNSVFYALSRHSSWNWEQQAYSWIPWKTPFKLDILYSIQRVWRTHRLCILHAKTLFSAHLPQVGKLKKVACFRSSEAPYWRYAIDYYSTTQLYAAVRQGTKYIFVVFNPHFMKQTYRVFSRVVYPALLKMPDCVCCLFYEPGGQASDHLLNMEDAFVVTERDDWPVFVTDHR